MTDFCLKFTDQATFEYLSRAIYQQMTGTVLGEADPTPRQGRSLTGTEWFVDEIGLIYEPTEATETDPFGNERPVMAARDGWHANLRWNGGDDPPPDNIPGMEVVWRSDARDENDAPIPRPAWWNRVIA